MFQNYPMDHLLQNFGSKYFMFKYLKLPLPPNDSCIVDEVLSHESDDTGLMG